MPLRATKNFTNKRSKSKKRKNGPQLPNYVQEQLLSRDAGIASGFENKDFLRLSLQDSNADGASDNGNKKNKPTAPPMMAPHSSPVPSSFSITQDLINIPKITHTTGIGM